MENKKLNTSQVIDRLADGDGKMPNEWREQRIFKGETITGIFNGVDFSFCDFSEGSLYGSHFERCKFRGTRFYKADLSQVTFDDCVFDACSFVDANLETCDFIGHSAFERCQFKDARLNFNSYLLLTAILQKHSMTLHQTIFSASFWKLRDHWKYWSDLDSDIYQIVPHSVFLDWALSVLSDYVLDDQDLDDLPEPLMINISRLEGSID